MASKLSFPEKLYQVVDNPLNHHLIVWESPNSFRIVSQSMDEFAARILPQLCNSNSMCSLVRQLNAYSFRKVGGSDEIVFQHDLFVRGDPAKLAEMKRRKPQKRRAAEDDVVVDGLEVTTGSSSTHVTPQATSLSVDLSTSAAAPLSTTDGAYREALLASIGCIQQLTTSIRHAALAAEAADQSSLATDVQVLATSATSAIRRLVETQQPSVPAQFRKPLPSLVAGVAGSGSSSISGVIGDLDMVDRALASVMAAVTVGKFAQSHSPATTVASSSPAGSSSWTWLDEIAKMNAQNGFQTNGEETYSSVEDSSLVRESERSARPPSKTPALFPSAETALGTPKDMFADHISVASVGSRTHASVSTTTNALSRAESHLLRAESPSSFLSAIQYDQDALMLPDASSPLSGRLSPPFE